MGCYYNAQAKLRVAGGHKIAADFVPVMHLPLFWKSSTQLSDLLDTGSVKSFRWFKKLPCFHREKSLVK